MISKKKPTAAQHTGCQYWDCGWCYAPANTENNSDSGACNKPLRCPQMKAKHEQAKP